VVLIGAVFIFATASWVLSAHKWFKGPIPNISDDSSTDKVLQEEKFSDTDKVPHRE
jgi:hypothetical protein